MREVDENRVEDRLLARVIGLCVLPVGSDKVLGTVTGRPDEQEVGYMSCLFFSSCSAVLEFLNVSGNAALLDGPIFRIEGLLTEDSGDSRDVFAIPTGIGRLLVDYRKSGVRGVANVAIVVSPEAGLNDGLLSLRVRTHNQCGVSARGILTCDFGEGWSKESAAAHVAASPSKKLKGALDACFMEQTKASLASEAPPEPVTAGEPQAKKQKIVAVGAVANLPPPAPVLTTAPAAAAASTAVPVAPVAALSTGLDVGTTDDWAVTIANSKLRVQNMKGSSRKLPPKTVLQIWRLGRLVEGTPAVKQFVLAKASELIVTGDAEKAQLTTVAAYVAAHSITQIYQHGKFPVGSSPNTFVCKKQVGYVPAPSEASIVPAVLAAVVGASNSKVAWVMARVDDKLAPVGIALVTTKQLVVPGNGVMAL
jgi:hypothetical protein